MEDNTPTNPPQDTPEIYPLQPLMEAESPSEKPKRSLKWFFIGAGVILFLALAAFFGAQQLKAKIGGDLGAGGGPMLFTSGGPGGQKSVSINMTPAKELPAENPVTRGVFVRRQDQSIFLGTGSVKMQVSPGNSPSVSYDGPVVEVVINHTTKIYQDTTDMNPGSLDTAQNGAVVKVQQIVKPGSLDDLGASSLVSVWGDKQGDRYVAKVITFK